MTSKVLLFGNRAVDCSIAMISFVSISVLFDVRSITQPHSFYYITSLAMGLNIIYTLLPSANFLCYLPYPSFTLLLFRLSSFKSVPLQTPNLLSIHLFS